MPLLGLKNREIYIIFNFNRGLETVGRVACKAARSRFDYKLYKDRSREVYRQKDFPPDGIYHKKKERHGEGGAHAPNEGRK